MRHLLSDDLDMAVRQAMSIPSAWRGLSASYARDINSKRVYAGSHAAKKMLALGMTGTVVSIGQRLGLKRMSRFRRKLLHGYRYPVQA